MKRIESVAVIGMGALGLLFGQGMYRALGDEHFSFVMDPARKEKYSKAVYKINDKPITFPIRTTDDFTAEDGTAIERPDLIVIATKSKGLLDARSMAKDIIGSDTIIISLLNGITSEEILGECLPKERIICSMGMGMDARREGTSLKYINMGRIQIGISDEAQKPLFDSLIEFFERTDTPYEICPDIQKAMWNKFMINIGVNQTCMVYNTTYGGALSMEDAFSDMKSAMEEVMAVAAARGINLTREDFDNDIAILESLDPEGFPSMQQDAMAKRKTEVDMFAGTLIEIAGRYGIPVPTNEKYYKIIKEMESNTI